MININPVAKPCCQKVLPLVYDDSLSYYETLCKLTAKMNEIITAIDDNFDSILREELDKLFVNAMYDANTETLILSVGIN